VNCELPLLLLLLSDVGCLEFKYKLYFIKHYLSASLLRPDGRTQLSCAKSPNQVFYNTKVDGEDNGPQRDGALGQPGRSSERVVSVR
jgi:hypothetical protein